MKPEFRTTGRDNNYDIPWRGQNHEARTTWLKTDMLRRVLQRGHDGRPRKRNQEARRAEKNRYPITKARILNNRRDNNNNNNNDIPWLDQNDEAPTTQPKQTYSGAHCSAKHINRERRGRGAKLSQKQNPRTRRPRTKAQSRSHGDGGRRNAP